MYMYADFDAHNHDIQNTRTCLLCNNFPHKILRKVYYVCHLYQNTLPAYIPIVSVLRKSSEKEAIPCVYHCISYWKLELM